MADTRPCTASSARPLQGVRVLVVDDDPDVLETTAMLLVARGAIVRAAASVDEALAILDTAPCDVVLSDLSMPARDGFELVRILRGRDAPFRSIAAAALSAVYESRQRALAEGFDTFLPKPVEPKVLVETVLRLAPRAERARGASAS